MNVTDMKGKEVELIEGDMLKTIFAYQHSVADRMIPVERKNGVYIPEEVDINSPKDQEYLNTLKFRVIRELVEAAECLKNKPWKETHVLTDVEHYKEELADALHFFIELCIQVGITPEELFQYYMKKNAINHWRRDTKY